MTIVFYFITLSLLSFFTLTHCTSSSVSRIGVPRPPQHTPVCTDLIKDCPLFVWWCWWAERGKEKEVVPFVCRKSPLFPDTCEPSTQWTAGESSPKYTYRQSNQKTNNAHSNSYTEGLQRQKNFRVLTNFLQSK